MSKQQILYTCTECGATFSQWHGQCSKCKSWNSLQVRQNSVSKNKNKNNSLLFNQSENVLPLYQAKDIDCFPFSSGLLQLDKILGNGLVPGSSILIGGEPGIGKSTLILQIACNVSSAGKNVLYASGEETLPQIKARASRIGKLNNHLFAISTSHVENIHDIIVGNALSSFKPDLAIIDSVQTLTSTQTDGLPGNISQVKAVASILLETCRSNSCTLILIGHVTKDGTLAGPRLLEHMVDSVISIEGDRKQQFRLFRVYKNRFGANDELLVFKMTSKGMQIVDDPTTFFLEARNPNLSGTAVVMSIDGQRPLAVEIQALATKSFLSIPRRVALGLDVNRMHLLLAVLEKRLKINLGQTDIYAKVGGGIRLQDPGIDLALVVAVLSSYYDLPVHEKNIFWGEIDLNGQIRPVSSGDMRITQARKLGFNPIIPPQSNENNNDCCVATLGDLQRLLFRSKSN